MINHVNHVINLMRMLVQVDMQ